MGEVKSACAGTINQLVFLPPVPYPSTRHSAAIVWRPNYPRVGSTRRNRARDHPGLGLGPADIHGPHARQQPSSRSPGYVGAFSGDGGRQCGSPHSMSGGGGKGG